MIPMSIATPFSKHPQLRSPKGLPRRVEGASASMEPSRARDVRVSGRTRRLGRTAEPVTRRSGQGHNGDGANEGQTQQWKGCIYLARPRNTYRTPLAQDGKFCFPKNEWRADSELCKRADTVAIEAATINSAYASASNLGVAIARWIKCAHQNC